MYTLNMMYQNFTTQIYHFYRN